ncbi:hypothetical protein [Ideonella alba]|uniref:Uncharacterized protein n=1 Tax=Ideonella alba TaxID=2824118 RepID=A0A940Y540_9BURK|nr:hypothetical protein [Ideonella alba]MBQ0930369.1 hypothetical protein [Ideonella alba]
MLIRAAFGALFVTSLPVLARDLCTLDAQFTICQWGKVSGCELLDEKQLASPLISADERALINAVKAKVQGKVFDLKEPAREFGNRAILDKPVPGVVGVTWVRDTPNSDQKTTFGFDADHNIIQIAGVSVPDKFTVRWCNKPSP